MEFSEIVYQVSDRIATITLNRPDRMNAWTLVMEAELRSAIEQAAADDGVRAIVLTGAGRAFCAGADFKLLQTVGGPGARKDWTRPFDMDRRADWQGRYSYFPAIGKPIVAMINGAVAGLGLVIALYCDLRFAGESAAFSTAFARRGLIAEHGLGWLLPRIVGHASALDLLLSARKFHAPEALQLGLVNRVHPDAELRQRTFDYVRELVDWVSPRSIAVIKRQVYDAPLQTLAEAIADANRDMRESFKSEDFREGVAHYLEKRPPKFTGR